MLIYYIICKCLHGNKINIVIIALKLNNVCLLWMFSLLIVFAGDDYYASYIFI